MSRTSGSSKLSRALLGALSLFLVTMNLIAVPALAQEVAGPTIASDKADYAPGELVTLTGTGWAGDTTVNIVVNDTLGKTWARDADVLVDGSGNVIDSFNLPAWFVSDYDVTATGNETGRVATTTFTDAVTVDYQHWLDLDADWANGALQQTNSAYFEGEMVPHYFEAKNLSPSTNYTFRITFDYKWDTKNICGFSGLGTYNTDRTPANVDGVAPALDGTNITGSAGSGNFYTVGADVTGIGALSGTGIQRYVEVSFTSAASAPSDGLTRLYWGLELSLPNADGSGCAGARAWPGASLQTNVADGATGVPIGGGGTLQINPKAVQANSDLLVTKSDSPDPVVQGSNLTYTVVGTNNGPGTATDVEIKDTLPAFTTFSSYTVSAGFSNVTCSASSGVVTCKGTNSDPLILIPGSPITITITVAVAANAPTAGTVQTGECAQNADRTSGTAGVVLQQGGHHHNVNRHELCQQQRHRTDQCDSVCC